MALSACFSVFTQVVAFDVPLTFLPDSFLWTYLNPTVTRIIVLGGFDVRALRAPVLLNFPLFWFVIAGADRRDTGAPETRLYRFPPWARDRVQVDLLTNFPVFESLYLLILEILGLPELRNCRDTR